jgi:dienelactone hydrolase
MSNRLRPPETRHRPRAPRGGRRPRTGSPWGGRAVAVTALGTAIIAFLLIVFGGGGGSGHTATQPGTSAANTRHQTKAAKHGRHRATSTTNFRVGRLTLTLLEPSPASIASVKTANGSPARQLITSVRYPALGTPNGRENSHARPVTSSGPFPLIVFSQGYDTNDSAYAWLMDKWTSAGYVVAAPTYPFTAPTSSGGPNEADIVNHPADLRFVITSLLKSSGQATAVRRLIDPAKVAVIGQSDGGDVSLAVVANSCCRIPTVKAAVILSGAELARFGGSYYSGGGTSGPLLAVQGSADTINPPGCSAQFYDQAPQPKYYLDLVGASHLAPYTLPGSERTTVAAATTAFLDRYLKGRQSALSTLHRAASVSGVATLTTGNTAPGASTSCPGAP